MSLVSSENLQSSVSRERYLVGKKSVNNFFQQSETREQLYLINLFIQLTVVEWVWVFQFFFPLSRSQYQHTEFSAQSEFATQTTLARSVVSCAHKSVGDPVMIASMTMTMISLDGWRKISNFFSPLFFFRSLFRYSNRIYLVVWMRKWWLTRRSM